MIDDLSSDLESIAGSIPAIPNDYAILSAQIQSLPPPVAPSVVSAAGNAIPPDQSVSAATQNPLASLGTFIGGGPSTIPGSAIIPGSLGVPTFATTVRPVVLVTALPSLPSANFPVGSFVYKTNDVPARLYKNVADAWVAAIGPNDIQADSITAGQIAAGAIGTSELLAGSITLYDANLQTALSPSGFGPVWRRFLMAGCFNGDFYAPTPTPANNIDTSTNKLPNWALNVISGSAVTAKWVSDSGVASGGRLGFSLASGAAGDDAGLEQIVPVNGSAGRSFAYQVAVAYEARSAGSPIATPAVYVWCQYLKNDAVTTTGSAVEATANVFSGLTFGGRTWRDLVVNAGNVPADAYFLKIRIGLRRNTAATTSTLSDEKVGEVRVIGGSPRLVLADDYTGLDDSAYTYKPGYFRQTLGVTYHENASKLSVAGDLDVLGNVKAITETTNTGFTINNGGTATFGSKSLIWSRVGNWVLFTLTFTVTAAGSGASVVNITGTALPQCTNVISPTGDRSVVGATRLLGRMTNSGGELAVNELRNLSTFAQITGADLANTAVFTITGMYRTSDAWP